MLLTYLYLDMQQAV